MAAGDKSTGRNLVIEVEDVAGSGVYYALPCPQGYQLRINGRYIEYQCPGTDGVYRIYDGNNGSGSLTFLPANNGAADATFTTDQLFPAGDALGVKIYPDGKTNGLDMYTFDAYIDYEDNSSRGSVRTITVPYMVNGDVTMSDYSA